MDQLDARLNAFRPDLADIALKGRVTASRFAEGEVLRVAAPQAPVRRSPSPEAMLLTEALQGEAVRVFETNPEGWAWCQLQEDRYVGWIPLEALEKGRPHPTHKVSALRTLAFGRADIKAPPIATLPFGARVAVTGAAEDRNARYALIEPAGAVVVQHLKSLDAVEKDWTSVAERFLGAPYLWGGKTAAGIDCSGLLQIALGACGIPGPRDTDMQEAQLGKPLPFDAGLPQLKRGDLVFWKGHVGIMLDADVLLHANAHHMEVAAEPLRVAIERLSGRGADVTTVRRIAGE